MISIRTLSDFLDEFAPTELAEDWDNVGLLVGDAGREVKRVMTCLTVTPESAAEAIERQADLIVSHHPLPFRPLKRLTTDATPSKLLWELIRAGVAIYSPHTGFDSAAGGINASLAAKIKLTNVRPLMPTQDNENLGAGRIGDCDPVKLSDFVKLLKMEFGLPHLQCVGESDAMVSRVAIACGSGGSFLDAAIANGCNAFLTGEASFHSCLEAQAREVSLVLLGHYASERFAVEMLADKLADRFSPIEVWPSTKESDPVVFM